MSKDYSIYSGSNEFDRDLTALPHFDKFPEMMPWIGSEYITQNTKILILGESHYFKKGIKLHHDPKAWYSRTFAESLDERIGHRVRYQISRAINGSFKGIPTHLMHKNLHNELRITDYFKNLSTSNGTPFDAIAYLNYFQRPANRMGRSISVEAQDIDVARETIEGVIKVIKPEVVLFASVKAYKTAIKSGLFSGGEMLRDYSAHPCSVHWNKPCKKYGKLQGEILGPMSGKERFVRAINKMTSLSTSV